jgi:hypothetical protein
MARGTIRGPAGHAQTTLVPPIGRVFGHVPTATDGHTGNTRGLVLAGRLVWRYRRELTVTAGATAVYLALVQVPPVVAAWAVWLALFAVTVGVPVRHAGRAPGGGRRSRS